MVRIQPERGLKSFLGLVPTPLKYQDDTQNPAGSSVVRVKLCRFLRELDGQGPVRLLRLAPVYPGKPAVECQPAVGLGVAGIERDCTLQQGARFAARLRR